MSEDIVSVIVPIYNVEKYLKKCIDSILNQTYKNIEIILLNDGSTDSTGKICEELENKDSRIVYINKENEGVSQTRNVGVNMAKGKYITFVDPDDFLEETCIETMYKEIVNENSDVVVVGTKNIDENGVILKSTYDTVYTKKMNMTNLESLKYILMERPFTSVCWGKIYKSSIIKEYKFNKETKIAEDLEILYKLLYSCKKVTYIPDKLYNWLSRKSSVTKQSLNDDWKNEIRICEEIIYFCKNNCPELEDYAVRRYVRINLTLIYKNIKNEGYSDSIKEMRNNIKKYKLKNQKLLSLRRRIAMMMFLYFPHISVLILKIK